MRCTAFHRPLRVLARQKTIDQTGGKRIAASNPIEDFQVFPFACLVEVSVANSRSRPNRYELRSSLFAASLQPPGRDSLSQPSRSSA